MSPLAHSCRQELGRSVRRQSGALKRSWRCFSSTGPAEDQSSETSTSKADDGSKSKPLPLLARGSLVKDEGEKKFSKLQRTGLGLAGSALAAGGFGGYVWLHWPLMGTTGACALAGAGGTALLALAAKGGVPAAKAKAPTQDKVLQMKLLNDEVRLKKESEALKKLGGTSKLPKDVEAALAAADKKAKSAAKEAATKRQKELLAEVKKELDAGVSADEIQQRLRPRLFVFDFNPSGSAADLRPQSMKVTLKQLTTSVDFILSAASKYDKALLRLTSPGGAVAPYGLAAAQLQRLRDAGVHLTICVDTVAASGGYMMAVVGDRIVATEFSMVGSIGVLAGVPNVHKVLEKNNVEFMQVTGGKYKRTVNVLTPNTEEGIAKFKSDVEDIHQAFKDHVHRWRPGLDIETAATGEVWLGKAALDRGLVDELGTSDEEIRAAVAAGFDAVELSAAKKEKKGLAKLMEGFGNNGAAIAASFAHKAGEVADSAWRKLLRGEREAREIRVEAPELRDSLR